MTTTIDTDGHIVADTTVQQAAATIADVVKAFGAADIPDGTWASLSLQPYRNGDVAWVDALAAALGLQPKTHQVSSGNWHRTAEGRIGPLRVTVLTGDAEPVEAKRERLAAELAAIDAQIAANGGEHA